MRLIISGIGSGLLLPEIVVDVLNVLHDKLRVASILDVDVLDGNDITGDQLHDGVGDVHGLHALVLDGLGSGNILLLFGLPRQCWLLGLLEGLRLLVGCDALATSVLDLAECGPLQVGRA